MKITIIYKERISSLDVDLELDIDTLKMIIQAELGLEQFELHFQNKKLESGSIQSNKIDNEDIVMVVDQPTSQPTTQPTTTGQTPLNGFIQQIQKMMHHKKDPVTENFEYCIEHHPEAFSHITMLFLPCLVNKVPLKMFIDSGAQSTILSLEMAKKCEIDHLIDKRFAGEARGVGTGVILGKIHAAELRIGNLFLNCTFTVLETINVDMLFGLDMLRRHQVILDLNRNVMKIQNQEFQFLSEHEVPTAFNTPKQPTQVPHGPQVSQNSNVSSSVANEQSIQQLIDLGAQNKQHAMELLKAANGNVEMAAALLFQ